MSGNTTEIRDPDNMSAPPKKFAYDHSYWSHDGYNERQDGYFEPANAKYADQVSFRLTSSMLMTRFQRTCQGDLVLILGYFPIDLYKNIYL